MSTDVAELLIAKPKKTDGTFVCNVKQPFLINLTATQLVHIKTNPDASQFVFLKNKAMYNYMYDLNNKITEVVKDNCGSWFNTNMNPDLIDDYYTTTLVYDKTHGDLIKLKVCGQNIFPAELVGSKLNISLIAHNLRFYKQKFVLETIVDKYDTGCDIIDFSSEGSDVEIISDEEEDVPYPSGTELDEMRNDIMSKTTQQADDLTRQLDELKAKLEGLMSIQDEIKNTTDSDRVIQLYDRFNCATDE